MLCQVPGGGEPKCGEMGVGGYVRTAWGGSRGEEEGLRGDADIANTLELLWDGFARMESWVPPPMELTS